MTQHFAEVCFNCGRGSDAAPILGWEFQGSKLWACSECTPLLIHKLDQVQAALQAAEDSGTAPQDDEGGAP